MITEFRSARDLALADLVDEITRRLQGGEPVDLEALAGEHPELIQQLQELLPTLQLLGQLRRDPCSAWHSNGFSHAGEFPNNPNERADPSSERTLGDFRLLREIGRGGMGVVYEAEQISLGRTVALKVLPFAAMLDTRQLTRFRNEARAAATLHHANIVPVILVGCERSVHFYAMQYIEGESLARIIEQMSGVRGQESVHSPTVSVGEERKVNSRQPEVTQSHHSSGPPRSALRTLVSVLNVPDSSVPTGYCPPPTAAETAATAFLSTARSKSDCAYFRTIAELGIQAAEALDHAHEQGVIHRDIKPANLLLDETGRLWITDFGLARLESDAGMTMTGDLIGTLRYMSPEQALAKRVVVDHRTDIYSLGVTLYELLTLRPAFDGEDRQHLLKQIAFEDPPLLRKFNREIPAELETIVEKAIRKNPAERYGTARELADDLRSFLANKPIKAKPPTWGEKMTKWMQRHPAGVRATLIAASTILIVVAASIGWIVRDRAARRSILRQQVNQAVEEAHTTYKAGKLSEAVSAVKRAEGFLAGSGSSDELQQPVAQWRADLDTVMQLEQIRLDRATTSNEGGWGWPLANASYGAEFKPYGLDANAPDVQKSAELIRNSPISLDLVAALDDWYLSSLPRDDLMIEAQPMKGPASSQIKLLDVASLADSDPWRNRLRDAIQRNDHSMLTELAGEAEILAQPTSTILLLARALDRRKETSAQAIAVLRQALVRHPGDFWINIQLAICLPENAIAESVAFARSALSLRPDSPGARRLLVSLLCDQHSFAEAEAICREAIRRKPDDAHGHVLLANTLRMAKRLNDSEAPFRESIRLQPDSYLNHQNFGWTLYGLKRYREAEMEWRESIRINPNIPLAYDNLAMVLNHEQRFAEAEGVLREALRLEPDWARAHTSLAESLRGQHRVQEAVAEFREAIRLNPKDSGLYGALGDSLSKDERFDEANDAFREGIRIDPNNSGLRGNYAASLARQAHANSDNQLSDQAAAEYAKAIDDTPDRPLYSDRVNACRYVGQWENVFNRLVKLRPEEPAIWVGRGDYRVARSQWAEAAADYSKGIHTFHLCDETDEYALLLLLIGDTEGYQQFCRELLDRFGEPKEPRAAFLMARACAAAPCDAVPPARAVGWALKAVDGERVSWHFHALSLADYRAGQFADAIQDAEKSNELPWGQDAEPSKSENWLVMAMANYHLGNFDTAQRCLKKAGRMIAAVPRDETKPNKPVTNFGRVDWISIKLLSREAEALLNDGDPNGAADKEASTKDK